MDELELDVTPEENAEWLQKLKSIAGQASCGCVFHAEDGIPCSHDIALAAKQGQLPDGLQTRPVKPIDSYMDAFRPLTRGYLLRMNK